MLIFSFVANYPLSAHFNTHIERAHIITFDSTGNYVIATDAGVRMTYNSGTSSQRHELTVTANGCFADGKLIGTGSGGNVVAVWGS